MNTVIKLNHGHHATDDGKGYTGFGFAVVNENDEITTDGIFVNVFKLKSAAIKHCDYMNNSKA